MSAGKLLVGIWTFQRQPVVMRQLHAQLAAMHMLVSHRYLCFVTTTVVRHLQSRQLQ